MRSYCVQGRHNLLASQCGRDKPELCTIGGFGTDCRIGWLYFVGPVASLEKTAQLIKVIVHRPRYMLPILIYRHLNRALLAHAKQAASTDIQLSLTSPTRSALVAA